jgi:hypothetical protein
MEDWSYNMIFLDELFYSQVYKTYCSQPFFFPLIAGVLNLRQKGKVFVNQWPEFSQVYVEHSFGFAQIFGEDDSNFEEKLKKYFFINQNFSINKVRLYAPTSFKTLTFDTTSTSSALRQRAILKKTNQVKLLYLNDVEIIKPNLNNISSIDSFFRVATRFWTTYEDFLNYANPHVLLYKNQPAALCYAAACENNSVELDIITLDAYRNQGFGKIVASHFINQCQSENLDIYWDCFENNLASMKLAKLLNFNVFLSNYKLFTITKKGTFL